MFFSITIPVYNVENYLKECLDSILCQSFADFQLVLVDDGSKDSSGAICDEYAEKDSRVKVVHKENGGQSDARNVALDNADGDYVIYLDSDDYFISPDFLLKIHNKIQETNSDIVIYKFQQFKDGESTLAPCSFSYDEAKNIDNTDELLEHLVKIDGFYASAWTKAIKKTLLTENNIKFHLGISGEDNEWYVNLLTSCPNCKISAIDEPFVAYRQRVGSVSKTYKLKNLLDYIYVMEKCVEHIKNSAVSEIRRDALNSAVAKFYANIFICYLRIPDPEKKKYKKQVKDLSFLLNYAKSQRPILIKKVYSIVGFEGTVMLLKILDKVKG